MKYISKLLVLFAIVMMATACKDDINEVNYPLEVSVPSVSSVSGSSAVVSLTATGSHITLFLMLTSIFRVFMVTCLTYCLVR